jgi:hypothetical protein
MSLLKRLGTVPEDNSQSPAPPENTTRTTSRLGGGEGTAGLTPPKSSTSELGALRRPDKRGAAV